MKWISKEDVTQDVLLAAAQHLGEPGCYVELGGDGVPTMALALLSIHDLKLLESAKIKKQKEAE